MTRNEAAAYIGARLGAYLSAVDRTAVDSAGNLLSAIDDALRALGYAADDLAAAVTDGEDEDEDFRVQLIYRALLQITRDLAVFFTISTAGDSFSLQSIRQAAEKDLADAKAEVLARFGTLGVVSTAGEFVTIDTNILVDRWEVAS